MRKIFLTTKDGVKIVANLYPAELPMGWIVFSHMMPAAKESWNDLAEQFCGAGYESVAVDLRGHGESVSGLMARFRLDCQGETLPFLNCG